MLKKFAELENLVNFLTIRNLRLKKSSTIKFYNLMFNESIMNLVFFKCI